MDPLDRNLARIRSAVFGFRGSTGGDGGKLGDDSWGDKLSRSHGLISRLLVAIRRYG